jgi:tRNA wybutosine-synthesizing protein 1
MQDKWDEMTNPSTDEPKQIVEGCFKAQEKIVSGYKGNQKADWRKFQEAQRPNQVAISLTGEPTLYKHLGELIDLLHQKGLSTFLVTNGNLPSKLSELNHEPTQLYVSLCAPNEQVFKKVCRPQFPAAWTKLNETLELLKSFRCPTAIRMTMVKEHNMDSLDDYARLIDKANPTYIEAKAYMHIGFSNLRLGFNHMPMHEEVKEAANQLAIKTGYKVINEAPESRVVLLSKLDKPIQVGKK